MSRLVAKDNQREFSRSHRYVPADLWIVAGDFDTRRRTAASQQVVDDPLADITRAIADSSGIGGSIDVETGEAYETYTCLRAATFLRHFASLREFGGKHVSAPHIDPGPHGSIDLHWKLEGCELLINVPNDPNLPPSYYGDDYGKSVMKGFVDSEKPMRVIAVWLSAHQ